MPALVDIGPVVLKVGDPFSSEQTCIYITYNTIGGFILYIVGICLVVL